ncbi:MAG: RagB/SusD family nutrient uptake outer membrane protein [Candidatus Pseudobacter hemicellulosilyticus]|uniref:RagB/SusD family nutrient uptake outer membrane protein n=1 Tax=Candidatus Pseudobacter hemicellulosilyticus TaxID=3121375 RepID=A0AAJ5WQD7_9BACT|nr:MAG: RagB/SusD family nutrient uptake outer membrane protein [Pseudobacter sp.]
MNKTFLYIALLLFGLGATSCKKYFEVDNSDRNTIPLTFSTIEGFRASILGTLQTACDYYSNQFYFYPEVAGNMADVVGTGLDNMKQQQDFTSDPDEETQAVGLIWRKILVTIANANNIIEYAPAFLEDNPAAKSELDQIKAQALFIRALGHFDLCRVYAQPYNYSADAGHTGVPIVLNNPAPEDAIARSTVKEVYTQIIADLKEAEELFGTVAASDVYYVTPKAVKALLARVYLYSEHWDEAIQYASEVISSSTLSYNADYTSMFNTLTPGAEAIFRLKGRVGTKDLGGKYSITAPVYVPADTLMSLFEPGDIRLSLFMQNPDNTSRYFTRKWTILGSVERYDPMVLRASEMYFIRAEANLAKDQLTRCADDLKVMIGRAMKMDPADMDNFETEKAALKSIIIKERAKEFCFEGHNFFDITRMKENLVRGSNSSSTVKQLNYPSDYFVLPIPQAEIDANPAMKGNPTVNN